MMALRLSKALIKNRRMSSCMARVAAMSATGVTVAQIKNTRRGYACNGDFVT